MRKIVCSLICVMLALSQLYAQTRTITGKITDDKGAPIPNASITVKNSNIGTTAGTDGSFTLRIPANAKTVVVSSVGLGQKEVAVTNNTNAFNISLSSTSANLSEVVVTALGISRDRRSLGYATQTLKSDQLADRGEVNLVNALQGKVAGVNITNASGAPGASTNINIRGISSFTGSNQPLFVVDGIPISNDVDRTNGSSQGTLGDAQPANRALDIDMNNVESVNILKGPAAAVLYGSRAAAGAIIITTKKGATAKGRAEVIVNSNYSIQDVSGLPKVQNEFGQGTLNVYNSTTTNSWGPRFGSTPTILNGLIPSSNGVATGAPAVDYRAYPNNINDFFERGSIADNNITINGGDLLRNQTFSIGNVTQLGILPNSSLKRTNLKFGANSAIGEKIKLGGSITYINTVQKGITGGNNNSALANVLGLARSIDLTSYKVNGTYKNPDGTNNYLFANTDNPYFDAYENPLTSNVSRFIGNTSIGYDMFSWLNIAYRLGLDTYTDRRKQIFAVTSGRVPLGQTLDQTIFRSEVNGDLIITAKKNDLLVKDLNVTGLVGQNINQRKFQTVTLQGDNLAVPGFYNASNATVFTNGSGESSTVRRLVGYYAQASLSYKNYLFLELTGRADQSSTLPTDKNTYFYPSISAGFVFTDALKINSDILSYGKIRASAAKVGRDADPYLLSNLFVSQSYGNNVASVSFPLGTTAGFGASSRIAPLALSPEFTTSYEVGTNLQFFKNRVSVDFSYFSSVSKDQILNVAIPSSTGYSTYTTNVGELTNKGVELLVTATVLKSQNFTWDVTGNYTRIRNLVVSIAPGVDNTFVPGNRFTGSIASFKQGYPYGVIIGNVIPKSPDGQRLINSATGTYVAGVAGGILADPNPDYSFGFTNNIGYKGINLGFTFDFTKGGQVLSFTAATYKSRGVLDITAADRDQPHILPGVIQIATDKYIPNNIQIPAQTYWQALGGLQSEFNVYDATVFRLREVTLGYSLPSKVTNRLKLNGIRFGVFGRNLFYVAPNAPFDPSLNTQGAGNIRGLDIQGAPNARTMGANLRITL
jgi:TonB-linked SusC/RagA family outer membrane protein